MKGRCLDMSTEDFKFINHQPYSAGCEGLYTTVHVVGDPVSASHGASPPTGQTEIQFRNLNLVLSPIVGLNNSKFPTYVFLLTSSQICAVT